MRGKDFLTIKDFTGDELSHLLDLARDIKANPHHFADSLKGKTLVLIFEKPSLRTRVTFDVGIQQLGEAFNTMADRLVELQENVRRQERRPGVRMAVRRPGSVLIMLFVMPVICGIHGWVWCMTVRRKPAPKQLLPG